MAILLQVADMREPSGVDKRNASPLKRIRLFCLECMGGSPKLVRECLETACHFHVYRFGTVEEGGDRRALRAIRRHCLVCVGGDRAAVRQCTGRQNCVLWPCRFGVKPKTVEKMRARRKRPRELALPGLEGLMRGK